MSGANWIDVVMLFLLVGSVLFSFVRGFVREAIALTTWIACLGLAVLYYARLAAQFTMIRQEMVRNGLAFVVIVILVLIVGGVINYFVSGLIKVTRFKTVDRALGFLFGLTRALVLLAIPLIVLQSPTFEHQELPPAAKEAMQKSRVLPYIAPIAAWITQKIPTKDLTNGWMFEKMKGLQEREKSEEKPAVQTLSVSPVSSVPPVAPVVVSPTTPPVSSVAPVVSPTAPVPPVPSVPQAPPAPH